MNKYEELVAEYPSLDITEKNMKPEGLYSDQTVWIKKDLPTSRKVCVLAEELGHYETTEGHILDAKVIGNLKQEQKARSWAHRKMVPIEDIFRSFVARYSEPHEMAEFLGVDEKFLRECLREYGFI